MNISIWEKETFFAPQDVIIIGSGFTGLWTAWYLKKKNPDLKITILERGLIPTGASSRNAGFACFGSLSEVVADARNHGYDSMLELVEMRFKGIEKIRKVFGKEVIDYERCGGFELYHSADHPSSAELDHQINYINSLLQPITGTHSTYERADAFIDAFGFGKTLHMVRNPLEGALHSGKLLQALLRKVQGKGVQVITQTTLHTYHREQEGFVLHTNQPFAFHTRQVLFCTNAFTRSLYQDLDIIPARGQVLLTSPIPDLPFEGTFHADEGFYYFRNLGNRVLLGGARNQAIDEETTTDMHTSDRIQLHLERYLDEVILPAFRGQYQIEHRWAGIMGMGTAKGPIVKELQPSLFCAVRMSGMGVALAPVVAKEAAALLINAM